MNRQELQSAIAADIKFLNYLRSNPKISLELLEEILKDLQTISDKIETVSGSK